MWIWAAQDKRCNEFRVMLIRYWFKLTYTKIMSSLSSQGLKTYMFVSKDRLTIVIKPIDFHHSIITANKQLFDTISQNIIIVNTKNTYSSYKNKSFYFITRSFNISYNILFFPLTAPPNIIPNENTYAVHSRIRSRYCFFSTQPIQMHSMKINVASSRS